MKGIKDPYLTEEDKLKPNTLFGVQGYTLKFPN